MTEFLVLLLLLALLGCAGYWWARWMHVVPDGYLGIIERRPGLMSPRHPEDVYPVRIHGSPGPQAAILTANVRRWLPSPLYTVRHVPRTYVPPGTIGVVEARHGAELLPGQLLGRYVECRSFQDGAAFLRAGGQMGRQPAVLREGSYDINPELFTVTTVATITGSPAGDGLTEADLREISIPAGMTGVVITRCGSPPPDDESVVGPRIPGHESFQRPWGFLDGGGQIGAQEQTLNRGGVYQINPWFARVVLVPTRELILEWSKREEKSPNNYDAALDQIVINVEGHRLHFDMSQTIRIPPAAAPLLVARFGEQEDDALGVSRASGVTPVQRFVERVLGRTIEGYCHAASARYSVLDFLVGRDTVTSELQYQVSQALHEWGVQSVRTTLNEFELEDDDGLDHRRRALATERDRSALLELQGANAELEARVDGISIETLRARRRAEEATLEERLRLLGADQVKRERLIAELAKMKVPQFIGSDAGQILQALPFHAAHALANRVEQATARALPPEEQPDPVEHAEPSDTGALTDE
jgi:hypothetical protein